MSEQLEALSQSIDNFINSNGSTTSSSGIGELFCKWCIQNLFDLTSDESIDAMTAAGADDNSIDAMIEINDAYLYVLQTKYKSSHSWEGITKFLEDTRRLQEGPAAGSRQEVHEAAAKIRDYIQQGRAVRFYYITNSEFTPSEKIKIDEMEKSYPNYTILDLNGLLQSISDKQSDIPIRFKGKSLNLKSDTPELIEINRSIIMSVSLSELVHFVDEAYEFLFLSNVRNHLRNTKINREIQRTIEEDADKFWYYNNGITIVCDDFKRNEQDVTLTTPQVVNGCQTANAIRAIFHKKTSNEQKQINGRVLVRIIKGASLEDRLNITKYTNSQNAVKGKDFLSLEDFQKKLQTRLREMGYYYEIQRGAFAVLPASKKNYYKGTPSLAYLEPLGWNKSISAIDAVQAYVAFTQRPNIAYFSAGELTPMGSYYDQIFNDDTPQEPEYFLYPYLVGLYAAENLNYKRGTEGFRRYANLFFVTAYFRTLLEILHKINAIDQFESNPINSEFLKILKAIFANSDVNRVIINLVDSSLEFYFDDYSIKELIKDDIRNFLKWTCGKPKAQEILKQKIIGRLAKPEYSLVIDKLKELTN